MSGQPQGQRPELPILPTPSPTANPILRPNPLLPRLATVTAVVAITAPVFLRLSTLRSSDHGPHLDVTQRLVTQGRFLPYFGFHLGTALAALWSANPATLAIAAALVLTAALAARTALTQTIIDPTSQKPRRAAAITLALLFVMPLWNWWKFPAIYLGQPTPNVWFNPTLIFAMPFALGLFALASRSLRDLAPASLAGTGALMVLSLIAKPNFVIALAPCYGVALAARLLPTALDGFRGTLKALGKLALACGPPLAALIAQYILTFTRASTFGPAYQDARVIFAPLAVWSLYSPNIPVSILLGTAFPVVSAACFPRQVWSDPRLRLAWATMAIALLQFALLGEQNHLGAANFAWGCYLTDYILFTLSAGVLLRQPQGLRTTLCWAILLLHTIAGLTHLGRYLNNPAHTAADD